MDARTGRPSRLVFGTLQRKVANAAHPVKQNVPVHAGSRNQPQGLPGWSPQWGRAEAAPPPNCPDLIGSRHRPAFREAPGLRTLFALPGFHSLLLPPGERACACLALCTQLGPSSKSSSIPQSNASARGRGQARLGMKGSPAPPPVPSKASGTQPPEFLCAYPAHALASALLSVNRSSPPPRPGFPNHGAGLRRAGDVSKIVIRLRLGKKLKSTSCQTNCAQFRE